MSKKKSLKKRIKALEALVETLYDFQGETRRIVNHNAEASRLFKKQVTGKAPRQELR
jgi:ABC-type phosphate transport system auxiliary subunit